MQPLTKHLLIDFQNLEGTQEEKEYQQQVFSSVKLNLQDLEQYEVIDHFVFCTNEKCKAVLTAEDKGHVYDWDLVESNPKEFEDVIDKIKTNRFDYYIWICGFCNRKNVIEKNDLKFASNKSKVIERQAVSLEQKKEPILLIVFDISGSMEEIISDKNQESISVILKSIQNTRIYEKIVEQEEKEIKQFLEYEKQQNQGETDMKKNAYKDFLKKNKLLMGMTEHLITQMNPQDAEKVKKLQAFCKTVKSNSKSIGFMFFSSGLFLSLPKRVVSISDHHSPASLRGDVKEKVNFDDFDSLFKTGVKYGHEYTHKISEFKFANLDINFSDSVGGQTALGPAIAMALGVASKHGPGSTIMVVTDGIANKGIFDQREKWEEQFKMLENKLNKNKCFLTVLECRNQQESLEREEYETVIDIFCKNYEDRVARKINIIFDKKNNTEKLIENIKSKLMTSINRTNDIWTNQVNIRCQHPLVTYDFEALKNKLFNEAGMHHLTPKIDEKKLKQQDYTHPFMTQISIRYENTRSGEQSFFLSYFLQKFIRHDKMKRSDVKIFDNKETFMRLLDYVTAEDEQHFLDNTPLSFVKETFRKSLSSGAMMEKSFKFPVKSITTGQSIKDVENYNDKAMIYDNAKILRGGIAIEEEEDDEEQQHFFQTEKL